MKWILGLMTASIVFGTSHPAAAAFKGCYERVYDAKYLRHHKKQQIVKIRLQIGVGQGNDGPFEYLDRVDAVFRKTKHYQGNLIVCQPLDDELFCGIESDGGTFEVTDRGREKAKQAIRITNKSYMRFDNEDDKLNIEGKGEHLEFRLYKVSDGACP